MGYAYTPTHTNNNGERKRPVDQGTRRRTPPFVQGRRGPSRNRHGTGESREGPEADRPPLRRAGTEQRPQRRSGTEHSPKAEARKGTKPSAKTRGSAMPSAETGEREMSTTETWSGATPTAETGGRAMSSVETGGGKTLPMKDRDPAAPAAESRGRVASTRETKGWETPWVVFRGGVTPTAEVWSGVTPRLRRRPETERRPPRRPGTERCPPRRTGAERCSPRRPGTERNPWRRQCSVLRGDQRLHDAHRGVLAHRYVLQGDRKWSNLLSGDWRLSVVLGRGLELRDAHPGCQEQSDALCGVLNNVDNVSVINRTETTLTLQWHKVDGMNYSYTLSYNGLNNSICGSGEDFVVTYIVLNLTAGTEYSFILYTVFKGAQSTGYNFTNVTTPLPVTNISVKNRSETALTLEWDKVSNIYNYSYTLIYNNQNISINESEESSKVTYTITDLAAGTEYILILYTVFKGVRSAEYSFTTVTTPHHVTNISVKNRSETAFTLEWDKVSNIYNYSYTLIYNNQNISINESGESSKVTYTIKGLDAGTEYILILYTVFKEVRSAEYSFTTVTTPYHVTNISVKNRSETALTLEWDKVSNIYNYSYTLIYNNQNISINGSEESSKVTYTIKGLDAGTEYILILYTVFKEVQSAEYSFTTVTTPRHVTNISVKNRNETALTLEWDKVSNSYNYSYTLIYNNQNISISGSGESSKVTNTITNLDAGTEYILILYTVFKEVWSAGYNFTTVTTPLSISNIYEKSLTETTLTMEWKKVSNNNKYNYRISYNDKNTNLSGSGEGSFVTYTVSNLTAGMEYHFTIYTVFKEAESRVPHSVAGLHCQYASGGYGLTLLWDPPNGKRTAVQVNISSQSFSHTGENMYIDGLLPAQWYTLTVSALSGPMESVPVSISCQTDPRGVIAGVVTFLLLAILILCIGMFIWHQKPKLLSKFKSSKETKVSSNKYKPIPLNKFPMHFNSMQCDQNRGFSEEYQDLSTVGTDQSCTDATLPENKSKNRFINVLAYDSTRVKLAAQNSSDSDYINANYINGYGKKNKQYIAAQGPLPSTVSDFWRMVWEQKSSAIVMLTNCTEGGKIKCEQYWPKDNMPCLYGNLLVSIQSEQKESCWTRREFIIRNESASKECAVTHFHFTAWPDHGVPIGTADLLKFRWLVRQHIETYPFSGPTVVHCSAGVGRTGTLIALDVLLQQMDKEEMVNIADCVHRMRLSRPLMVQTESQYVFLHQCIMDSLTPKEDSIPEPIYENSEMFYTNAMALKEYNAASLGV
ncbi:receptor-type tyrosine-protein phosphatase H [Silurus meridionalis]|nr:receptor-type tyrosine-protein phosphatase H [Silurus meridionalis]